VWLAIKIKMEEKEEKIMEMIKTVLQFGEV
jgi:hypothetical protein